MATTYVVLWEHLHGNEPDSAIDYIVMDYVDAANADQARRKVAESEAFPPSPQEEMEGQGVTLIAIPARNWKTGREQTHTP